MYSKQMRESGLRIEPSIPASDALGRGKDVGQVQGSSGLFGNVNVLALVYSTREVQGAENKRTEKENDYADQPHRVISASRVHPKRKPRQD